MTKGRASLLITGFYISHFMAIVYDTGALLTVTEIEKISRRILVTSVVS